MLKKFELPGVSFDTFGNGLKRCTIANANGRAVFTTHGAHFMEFAPAETSNLLWMSEASFFEPGKPIRGGIPVCWPYFGPDANGGPAHGCARLAEWSIEEIRIESDGDHSVKLVLDKNALPPRFAGLELALQVRIGRRLKLKLTTVNGSEAPFDLSCALHSYFSVADSSKIAVSGLDGVSYIDKVAPGRKRQCGDITISEEVDRVYVGTAGECVINDPVIGRRISISKSGSASTVVWNPWIAKAQRMPDFGDGEYRTMVCVETVNAADDARTLQPGESHTLEACIGLR